MSKSAPAPLTMSLTPKKGEASPAVTSFEEPAPQGQPQQAQGPQGQSSQPAVSALPPPRLSSRVQATIAVTVRLDEQRYERMKSWGTTGRRVTNQEIIVAALENFFTLSDEEREEGIARVRK